MKNGHITCPSCGARVFVDVEGGRSWLGRVQAHSIFPNGPVELELREGFPLADPKDPAPVVGRVKVIEGPSCAMSHAIVQDI